MSDGGRPHGAPVVATRKHQALDLDVVGRPVLPSAGVADAQADMVALDQWRPRMLPLQRLGERAADTGTALGTDVMATALQGYALLEVVGKNQGLEGLRQSLGTRFRRSSRPAETKAAWPASLKQLRKTFRAAAMRLFCCLFSGRARASGEFSRVAAEFVAFAALEFGRRVKLLGSPSDLLGGPRKLLGGPGKLLGVPGKLLG